MIVSRPKVDCHRPTDGPAQLSSKLSASESVFFLAQPWLPCTSRSDGSLAPCPCPLLMRRQSRRLATKPARGAARAPRNPLGPAAPALGAALASHSRRECLAQHGSPMPRPNCRRSRRAAGRKRWQQQLRPGAVVEGSTNVASGDPGLTGGTGGLCFCGRGVCSPVDSAPRRRGLLVVEPGRPGHLRLELPEGARGALAPRSSRHFAAV